jgi:hypothetical protein
MENKLLFIGALGAFFLATAATLVSDMHGIGDWFISSLQSRKYALNPAPIYGMLYTIAGYFGEPLLILSIAMLTVGLYGSWLKYHKSIAQIAMDQLGRFEHQLIKLVRLHPLICSISASE